MSYNLKQKLDSLKIDYSENNEDLIKNSRDTSLFQIIPKIIIYPKSKIEISEILKFINKNKGYHVVSRSGGTDMSGGALSSSIIFSFTKYLNKIISIKENVKESIVEPGLFYRDFEKETLKHNLLLPTFPASREICAVGGIVSNNSGGEKSLSYGKTNEYVQSLECVLSNGEIVNFSKIKLKEIDNFLKTKENTLEKSIYEEMVNLLKDEKNKEVIKKNIPAVSKNSAGYSLWNILKEEEGEEVLDLSQIITGSQGTLATITKINFRLITPKKFEKMLLIYLKDIKSLEEVSDIVMKYKPESFESYDKHTFKVAMKFLPSFIKSILSSSREKKNINFFKLIFSFWKEVKTFLFFGVPELVLIAEFADDDEQNLFKNIELCEKELKLKIKKIKTQFVRNQTEANKYWVMRRESFNLLRQKVKGLHTAPFIDDIIVPRQKLGNLLKDLIPILERYKLFYTIAGHVGDGNLHIIPLMNFDTEEKKKENIKIIKECSIEVYDLIKKYHGSTSGEHNDGLIRTPFLNSVFDEEMIGLFRKVKNIFDPKNILNPGKKVSILENQEKEIENNFKHINGF